MPVVSYSISATDEPLNTGAVVAKTSPSATLGGDIVRFNFDNELLPTVEEQVGALERIINAIVQDGALV